MNQKDISMPALAHIRILFIIIVAVIIGFYLFIQKPMMVLSATIISRNKISSKEPISSPDVVRCIVCVKNSEGRLGNRMFMIASAYGLAKLHSCHLYLSMKIVQEMKKIFVLDLSPLLIQSIEPNSLIHNDSTPVIKIVKRVGCKYIPEMAQPDAISQGYVLELTGYWQSYLTFAKHSKELRERIFVGTQSVTDTVSRFFVDLYQENFGLNPSFFNNTYKRLKELLITTNVTTWIGIHVRCTEIKDKVKFLIFQFHILSDREFQGGQEYVFLAFS